MGGLRSGTGTKRPDHSRNSGCYVIANVHRKKIKHLRSLFSDKLDPSCHKDKKDRDRAAGIVETEMDIKRRQQVILEARDIQDIARQFSVDAMEALVEIVKNTEASDQARIVAANSILDRGYGKAAATNLNINANMNGSPKDLDSSELDRRTAETLKRVERITSGTGKASESQNRPTDLRKYN